MLAMNFPKVDKNSSNNANSGRLSTKICRIDTFELEEKLAEHYPDAQCSLQHSNAFELIVATVLSAQTTDERVNTITPALFAAYPDAAALANASEDDVATIIKPLGFQKRRSHQLVALAQALVNKHHSNVPAERNALMELPGVGRKTANVVLGNAFAIPAITVDTHVGRLARRMGLTQSDNPLTVEKDLARQLTQSDWTVLCHRLITHGRGICNARNPRCDECFLETCPQLCD